MNTEIELHYNELIKKIHDKQYQKWFTLKDLVGIKNISYRSLKSMVKSIYDKFHAQGLIYRKSGRYYISYRILDEFQLQRPRKGNTIYSYDWKSNISWTTLDKYDVEYHVEIFKEVKNSFDDVQFLGCIEVDSSERNHVHLLSDAEPTAIKKTLNKILKKYLDDKRHYRLYCEKVNNKGGSVDYLMKNPQRIIN